MGAIARKFKMLHSILITFYGFLCLPFLVFVFCFLRFLFLYRKVSLKEINKQ